MKRNHSTAIGVLSLLLAVTPALAAPTSQGGEGGIAYASGGVADEGKAGMEAIGAKFNLHVLLADPSGAYLGGGDVTIRDSAGRSILQARADGPMFYAALPPGKYTVDVREAGRAPASQTVTVGAGKASSIAFHLRSTDGERVTHRPTSAEGAENQVAGESSRTGDHTVVIHQRAVNQ